MRKGNIGVAPEGLPFLFLLALTALAFAALRFWPLALVFLVLTWFSGHFFRDPERVVPSEDDIAVSPADGRVIRVEPKADPITGEVRPCISIFMNVFNVHVNRSPVAGRVEAIRYFPGKFFNAALDKASTDNERCAYLVRDEGGRSWVMVQVAGLIARQDSHRYLIMQEEKPVRRGVYILPNLFTTASLFTGFLAMLLAVQGNIEGSALAILFSALMDGLDGKVARLTNTASEFGIQYDSLADLVAFGVAPAFTSWMWVLEGYGKLGIGVAFLYVACTALRLARFNVCVTTVSKKFFVGLPCPAAGCAVAMFILFSSYLPSWLEARTPFLGLVVTFVMALLMVSRVRYFSFKEYGFLKTHAFSSMISALLVFVLILSQPVVFGFLLGAIYLLSGPIYTYIILPRRNRQLLGSLTQN